MSDDDHLFDRIATDRRFAAAEFEKLTEDQWTAPSLCAGWTVRDVLGHLVVPLEVPVPVMALRVLRARGSIDRAMDGVSRQLAQRDVAALISTLRSKAASRTTPPGIGPRGPLTDICIHLRDALRPLGIDATPPLGDWRLVLDFLTSARARRIFVGPRVLEGLSFRATDQDWSSGRGPAVSGPSESLALAMAGRTAVVPDLSGDGCPTLATRIG